MKRLSLITLVFVSLLVSVSGVVSAATILSDNFDDGNDSGWLRSDAAPFYSVVDGEYRINNYGGGATFSTRPDVTMPSKWSYDIDIKAWRPSPGVTGYGGIALVGSATGPWANYVLVNVCVHDTQNLVGLQIHWQTGASSINWMPYTQGAKVHLNMTRAAGSDVLTAVLTGSGGTLTATSGNLATKLTACKIPGVQVAGGGNYTYQFDNVLITSSGLTGEYISVDGTTGVYKYASGFGDDHNIPSRTSIDFTGAVADNNDKYLTDAYSFGAWHRSGSVLGAYSSNLDNAIIYRISLPDSGAGGYQISSGAVYFATKIYQTGGQVSLHVSKDGTNWSSSLQSDQNTADGWQSQFHDIAIPSEFTGGDSIYVKIAGGCAAAGDWASVEDWGIVLNLGSATCASAADELRWVAMDGGGIPGVPVYQGSAYRDAYTLLSAIGVQAVNRGANWWEIERVNGFFSWNSVDAGDPLDDSARYARNAGVMWIPHIMIHYRPFWMQGTKGATTPYDYIYPDGTTDKDHGQWSPPNVFFPGYGAYKSSAFFMQRAIEKFGQRFAEENPALIDISDGTYGEAYYGVDNNVNPICDPYTVAAWEADNPSTAMYSVPGELCIAGTDQCAFGRWWNGKLVDNHIKKVHEWGADALPNSGQILKSAVNGAMCQDQNAQVLAALPSNLHVCSFGGPISNAGLGMTQIAHQSNVAAWVESFLDETRTISQAITNLNQQYWDAYNQAGIWVLFGANAAPTENLEKFTWLINACNGTLVSGGDFESGVGSWSLDDARTASWGASTTYSVVGSRSLKVSTDSQAIGSVRSPTIVVAPGTEYIAAGFACSDSSHTCAIVVKEFNASGDQIAQHSSPATYAPGWRYVYHPFVTSAETATIRIALYAYGANGDVYFDYVTLRGSNLSNPGFEFGTANWTRESGGTLGVTSTGTHSGSQCAYLSCNGINTVVVSSPVICMGVRHRYWVSCWARTTGNDQVMLGVREYDSGGSVLKTTGYTCAPGTSWSYLQHYFTPDPRTVIYKVCLYYLGASGTAYFDDVAIRMSPLRNSGFENSYAGVFEGWSSLGGPTGMGQTNCPGTAAPESICTDGRHGLYVDGTSGGSGATAAMDVAAGRNYQIGCFVNGSDVAMRITQLSAAGSVIATQEGGKVDTEGRFQYMEQMFTAANSAARLNVALLNYSTERAYFDDVRVDILDTYSALGTISGLITDADTGLPVVGAEVSVPGGGSDYTDSAGGYTLRRATGTYSITVIKDGYLMGRSSSAAVTPGGAVNLSLGLFRSLPVLGSSAFSDGFTRANSTNIGTTETGTFAWDSSNCEIRDNRLRLSGSASAWLRNFTPSKFDVTFKVKLSAADSTSWVGLAYREKRLNDVAGPNYLVYITPGGKINLFYDFATIASATVSVEGWSAFHTVRIQSIGHTHKVWWDNVRDTDTPVINKTDTRWSDTNGFLEFCFSGVGANDEALIDDINSTALNQTLTEDHLSVDGTTGVYKYASGFGDDHTIPSHTAIDFGGAIVDNADKYLNDAYALGSWFRNGTVLGAFSSGVNNALIYRFCMPEVGAAGHLISGGQIELFSRLYETGAKVSLQVSQDCVNWSEALVADVKSGASSWEWRPHDVNIPPNFIGSDTIYVKINGSCPSANDWAGIEDWGIRLNLAAAGQYAGVTKLADLKGLADGTLVTVRVPMVVTAGSGVFADGGCYVEEPSRASGIKITGASGLAIGDTITFTGLLSTGSSGERVVRVLHIYN